MTVRKQYKRRLIFSGLINCKITKSAIDVPCVSLYYDFELSLIIAIINYKFATTIKKIEYNDFKTDSTEGYIDYAIKIFNKEYSSKYTGKIDFDEVHISEFGKDLFYHTNIWTTDNIKEIYGYIN